MQFASLFALVVLMNKPQSSKDAILHAAREAFVHGNGDFEMSDVAKRAGVSIGLAYHYFKSKDGLISALISDFYDRYDAVVNQKMERGQRWSDREFRRLVLTVEFLFADPVAPLTLGRMGGTAHVARIETERRERMIALAAENIARGQEKGEINPAIDPELASAAINGGLRQAVATVMKRAERPEPEAFVREVWGLVEGALSLDRR